MLPAVACTLCAFKLLGDLETGGWGYSRSSKVPSFDSLGMVFYSTSAATLAEARTVSNPRYTDILVKNRPIFSPLGAPVRGEAVGFMQRPSVTKN